MRDRRLSTLAVGLAAVAGVGVVLAPLLAMVRTVWVEGGSGALAEPGLTAAILSTLALAAAVTAVAVPTGTALALALRRPRLPGKRFWRVAVLLPVLVPDFVLGFSWLRAYGSGGFSDQLLGISWPGLQGPAGVAVVLAVNLAPLAYLVVAVGLAARAEPATERAARISGASGLTVLRTVTLPLLGPAIVAAAVLTFVLTMGAFAIPEVLGSPAGFSTVTTRIYADLTRSSDPALFVDAVTLALLLVVLAVLVVVPADTLLGPRLRSRRAAAADPIGAGAQHRWTDRAIAAAVGGYLALAVGLPLLGLLATAFTRAAGLAPTPGNLTLANFSAELTAANAAALVRSLLLAAVAATVLLVLGGCVAALEHHRGGRLLAVVATAALVLPGSTLAVGLLIAYGRWLGGTLAIILLAYVAKLWAFAHRPISGALDRLPPDELHAARVSGADALVALRTVALRPLAPALVAAWMTCFLTGLHEVTMSSLLYGPGSETLAVVVLNSEQLGQQGLTAALCVLLSVVLLVPAWALWTLRSVFARASAAAQRPMASSEEPVVVR